jgi:HlyD family secretion protein
MTKKLRAAALVGVAAIAAVVVTVWSRLGSDDDATTLTLYGNVDIREVELAFRVSGRLLEMQFDEGDAVTAGQAVARIDPEPYAEALAVADARVRQAEANLEKLHAGNRPQEVQRARAAVREAEAQFANAERDFERQRGLFESGAASEKGRDAALARRDEAAARLESAREALALAEEGFRAEDITAAKADVAAAMAARDQAETTLADTELTAPSAGVLIARIREPGAMIGVGAPVYSLSLRDPVYVRAYVNEPDLGRLAPGSAVEIKTDSSDRTYRGQIGFISPRAEFTPKSVQTPELRTDLVYRLRIVVPEADEGLRQGMPITVRVPLGS